MSSKFKQVEWSKALLLRLTWDDDDDYLYEIRTAYVHIDDTLYTKLLKAKNSYDKARAENLDITGIKISDCCPQAVIENDYEESVEDFDEYAFVEPIPDEMYNVLNDALPFKIDFVNLIIDHFGFYWEGWPHHSSSHCTTVCIGWDMLSDQERLYINDV